MSKKDDSETEEQLKSAEEEKHKLLAEQAKMKEEMEKLKEQSKSEGEEAKENKYVLLHFNYSKLINSYVLQYLSVTIVRYKNE